MSSTLLHSRIVLVCSICLLLDGVTSAASELVFLDSVKENDRDRCESIYFGTTLESLVSGTFRGVGRVKTPASEGGPEFEGKSSIFSCFDFSRGLQRFDRKDELAQFDFDNGGGVKKFVLDARAVLTPDRIIDWNTGNVSLIRVRDKAAEPSPALPFDIRVFGMAGIPSIERNELVGGLLERYCKTPVTGLHSDPEGVHAISWQLSADVQGTRTIWFDETKGFAPIRMEVSIIEPGGESRVVIKSQVTWQLVNGFHVHKSASIEMPSERLVAYDFEWENVNEIVPDERFTEEGLQVTSPLEVIDTRLGVPVVVKTLNFSTQDKSTEEHLSRNSLAERSRKSYWSTLIIISNLVAVGLLFVYLRRRSRQSL
jgi:hypothetical protein